MLRQFPKLTSKELLRRTTLIYMYESWDICKIVSIQLKWRSNQAFLLRETTNTNMDIRV